MTDLTGKVGVDVRVVRWLVLVVGVLMMTLGAAWAVYVGSDDVLLSRSATVGGDGQPLVSAADALAYEDTSVVIEAESSDGGVFVGLGNPVEVDSLVSGTDHFRIDDLARSTFGSLSVDGDDVSAADAGPEVGDPTTLDIWSDQVEGVGSQQLTADLDGSAVALLVAPEETDAEITLRYGVRQDGLFARSWIVAGVGLVLALGALAWILVSRRRARPGGPTSTPLPGPSFQPQRDYSAWNPSPAQTPTSDPTEVPGSSGDGAPPTVTRPPGGGSPSPEQPTSPRPAPPAPPTAPPPTTPPAGPPSGPPTHLPPSNDPTSTRPKGWPTERIALALGLGVTLVVSGCSASPDRVSLDDPTTVSLTKDQQDDFWADYDERNNAAIEQGAKAPYNNEAWKTADTGLVLEHDIFQTAIDKENKEDRTQEIIHDPTTVYSRTFTSYPTWTMTLSQTDAVASANLVNVFVRDNVRAPWLAAGDISLFYGQNLPKPLDPEDATPSDDQVAAGDEALEKLADFWATGDKPDGLDLTDTENLRTNTIEPHAIRNTVITAAPYDGKAPSSWDVKVEGGTLAVRYLDLNVRFNARPGFTISWASDTDDKILGEHGTYIDYDAFSNVIFFIPDDGDAKILGGDVRRLLPKD